MMATEMAIAATPTERALGTSPERSPAISVTATIADTKRATGKETDRAVSPPNHVTTIAKLTEPNEITASRFAQRRETLEQISAKHRTLDCRP